MSYDSVKIGENKIDARATDGYLDTADISELLNVPYQTVYSFIKRGKLVADSGSCIRGQRKKFAVEEFKRFLVGNPKYYARIFGEVPQKEEIEMVEETPMVVVEDSPILEDLCNKMESIEAIMKRNLETIERLTKENEELNDKKMALEKVIDMF